MKIKNDKDKIEAAIIKVEGRATARTCNYEDFKNLVEFAEAKLKGLGLAKKYWKGVTATYAHGAVCNSYKYPAVGTELTIEYFSSGWFLKGIYRGQVGSCPNGGYDRYRIYLPKATQVVFVENSPYCAEIRETLRKGLEVERFEHLKMEEEEKARKDLENLTTPEPEAHGLDIF